MPLTCGLRSDRCRSCCSPDDQIIQMPLWMEWTVVDGGRQDARRSFADFCSFHGPFWGQEGFQNHPELPTAPSSFSMSSNPPHSFGNMIAAIWCDVMRMPCMRLHVRHALCFNLHARMRRHESVPPTYARNLKPANEHAHARTCIWPHERAFTRMYARW